jgi:hypothetical protein
MNKIPEIPAPVLRGETSTKWHIILWDRMMY